MKFKIHLLLGMILMLGSICDSQALPKTPPAKKPKTVEICYLDTLDSRLDEWISYRGYYKRDRCIQKAEQWNNGVDTVVRCYTDDCIRLPETLVPNADRIAIRVSEDLKSEFENCDFYPTRNSRNQYRLIVIEGKLNCPTIGGEFGKY